jgi:serine/threonine-protein kinase
VSEIPVGVVVDGRYQVRSRLGSGGMADVFLAEDQQLGRPVALKLLHRRFAEDPGFVERFRREAQAAAGLQHPNVVSVYDRGTYDDTYYIAMEYLRGRSLKQLIRDEAPLDPIRAIEIATQILKAARFAHRRGVIHRDLKPHNVIIDDADHAKVTDFGIARAGASDMTETGSIMGTAQYLSPEQAQGHPVSAGSDLYSIGVVLYEMLTGRVPFDGDSPVTIALKHVSEAPVPPSVLNPAVAPELEPVVLWALNKDPADRPYDADQFILALDQANAAIVARGRGQRTASMSALAVVGAGPPILGASPIAPPPITQLPQPQPPPELEHQPGTGGNGVGGTTQPPAPPPHRRPLWPWLLALAVLVLIGAGVAVYLLTRPVDRIVPSVVGQQISVAQTEVQNAGLTPNLQYRAAAQPSGTVVNQNPLGGEQVRQGSTVTLTISQGPGNAIVPSVAQLSQSTAEHQITQAGLTIGRVLDEPSTSVPSGDATRTDPASGTSLPKGQPVTLFISSGPPLVAVPYVTGLPESAARTALQNAGFAISTSTRDSSTATAGNVISQSPGGGSKEDPGTTVSIVIATTPPPTTTTTTTSVPGVVGFTAAAARSQLEGAGFHVSVRHEDTTRENEQGIVLSQSPGGGRALAPGSTVTIVVGHYKKPPPPKTTTTTTTTPPPPPTTTTTTTATTTT